MFEKLKSILRGRSSEWRPYENWLGLPIDGETHVMRRWVNGEWQYREETAEETAGREDLRVW